MRRKGLFLNQIFHGAAQYFRKAIHSIDTGLVDVFVALLIHLNGSEADIGSLSQFRLRASVCCADTLQVGFRKLIFHSSIYNIYEFGDVRFVKDVVHFLQILKGNHFENVAIFSAGVPLIVSHSPADLVFPGASKVLVWFNGELFSHGFTNNLNYDFNAAFSCKIGWLTIFHALAD